VKIIIRPSRADDFRGCEELVRDAFWDLYRPGCVEHLIVHQARTSPELVLDVIAETEVGLLGCLIATVAHVLDSTGVAREVLYLGPLAVRPDYQGRGIGSQLMSRGLATAAERGFGGAFLYGDPGYYARFGFVDAATWAVTTPDGLNFDAFLGLELCPEGLSGVSGRLLEGSAFDVDPATLVAFDDGFAPREKHVLPGQFGQ
jgi:predicted N-acetyltransferase YhbS